MRIWVIAVGRLKAGPEGDLAADYVKRAQGLGKTAGIRDIRTIELSESRSATAALRKADEAKFVANAVPESAYRVALDEHGRAQSSDAFAAVLQKHLAEGAADIAFLIGGPDGHDNSTLASAHQQLSLGPMTWPHRLVRVMLVEQIYRAVTIMVNHPYHRS